jgi:hypothetical protein
MTDFNSMIVRRHCTSHGRTRVTLDEQPIGLFLIEHPVDVGKKSAG